MTDDKEIFFQRIDQLSQGEKTALKREVGRMIQDASGDALMAFYKCLPKSVYINLEGRWFGVACLYCFWNGEGEMKVPLEKLIGEMIQQQDISDSAVHRIVTLLDTEWDRDGYLLSKLARLIKMIRQKTMNVAIDFSSLLQDLIQWNYESQIVQRRWARGIFENTSNEEEKESK